MTMRRAFLALTAAAAVLSLHARKARAQGKRPNSGRGIPGATNMDHVGVTVPNLDEAVHFFVDVLGADELFRFGEGPGTESPASIAAVFDVDGRSSLHVAMLRLRPNINIELMQYDAPGQRNIMPRNSDVDAPHLAFWVEDMGRAAAYLAAHGCALLAGPLTSKDGPKAGQSIHYARTPWGLAIEVMHRPPHMPYEQGTSARLFGPVTS